MNGQIDLFDEIIVDNFAGGGGASTGIELATGRPVNIAINHDPDAIRMHKTNHPYTEHYQASVWDIDPEITAVKNSCVLRDDLNDYGENSRMLYGWHISDLKLYEKPKDIGKFYKAGMLSYDDWLYGIYNGNGGARSSYESYNNAFKLSKAPQSWCYMEA